MSFTNLGLSNSFLKDLDNYGFTAPTPIQAEAIPPILKKKDVLGMAKTGSGKTASFVLPILQNLQLEAPTKHREPRVLVLVPTRELADQVRQVFQDFIHALPQPLRCVAVYGGVSVNPQMQSVGNADIVVATPGRLLELTDKNALKLSAITTFVLDEADKMLNLGFKAEVDRILAQLPKQRQNLLFSATLSAELTTIKNVLLKDPVIIKIESETQEEEELINQVGYFVEEEKKGPLLRYLITHENRQQVLVFASSIHKVAAIVNKLLKNNIDAVGIHGKVSQQARREALREFKAKELRVLVTTDLLARGIDIEFLPCVINYELPRSPKDYIHRIGRTGRAESPGDALSLVSPEERQHFRVIQKKMGKRVPIIYTEDLDLHGY